MVGLKKCVFVPSGGALGLLLGCYLGPLLLLGCFGFLFGFLGILFVYLEARLCVSWVVVLGFLCMLEALCILVLVYLEALCAFFWYNTLTYQKKKNSFMTSSSKAWPLRVTTHQVNSGAMPCTRLSMDRLSRRLCSGAGPKKQFA
jgi:hypothetical protein